jgi:hypothetical protein
MRILSVASSARLLTAFLTATVLLMLPASLIPQDHPDQPDHHDDNYPPPSHRFDGQWLTTVSCEPSRGALGFSYQFTSVVTHGYFDGLHGTDGQPGFLHIKGPIFDDGTGKLYANGMTGSKEFVPGTDTPRGTEFGYHINSHFDKHHGEGTRVEGRACSLEFEKQ